VDREVEALAALQIGESEDAVRARDRRLLRPSGHAKPSSGEDDLRSLDRLAAQIRHQAFDDGPRLESQVAEIENPSGRRPHGPLPEDRREAGMDHPQRVGALADMLEPETPGGLGRGLDLQSQSGPLQAISGAREIEICSRDRRTVSIHDPAGEDDPGAQDDAERHRLAFRIDDLSGRGSGE